MDERLFSVQRKVRQFLRQLQAFRHLQTAAALKLPLQPILRVEQTNRKAVGFDLQLADGEQGVCPQKGSVRFRVQDGVTQLMGAGKTLLCLVQLLVDVDHLAAVGIGIIAPHTAQRLVEHEDVLLPAKLKRIPALMSAA